MSRPRQCAPSREQTTCNPAASVIGDFGLNRGNGFRFLVGPLGAGGGAAETGAGAAAGAGLAVPPAAGWEQEVAGR